MATSDRDLGLAYAQMAVRGDRAARRARDGAAAQGRDAERGDKKDHELHAQLGFLEQIDRKTDEATKDTSWRWRRTSRRAGGGDLALIEAQRHDAREAIRLWGSVFAHDPAQLKAGMNWR